MIIRPYHPSDLPAVYRVCHATDATGTGASSLAGDADLPGHVYAGPYATADPDLCHVLVGPEGLAGYVVATADVREFRTWLDEQWWPPLRPRYADLPRPAPAPWHRTHPAELHIKIAAGRQGGGWGRRLATATLDRLAARGVPGAHVGVAKANARGIRFWQALGFTPAHRHSRTTVLLSEAPRASDRCGAW